MKILFLVYHGFSEASGISKKIHYQVKGLCQNGHEVHLCYYDRGTNGHWQRLVETYDAERPMTASMPVAISDFGTGKMAGLRQRISYGAIANYCTAQGIGMVYARCFQNANPWLVGFFRRLKKAGIRAVMEIPTYPYDQEFQGFSRLERLQLRIDQLCRRHLAKQLQAIVTFTNKESIFGQRTIRISNGVDLDSMPLHQRVDTTEALHLIGVAEVHFWHGFDRLIAGLGEYYRAQRQHPQTMPRKEVYFHIVGGVWHTEMEGSEHARGFRQLIAEYGIADKVVFHGQLFGHQLDAVFSLSGMAIGSLARYRSGISDIKTLKNREYASRGLPFIYSENDSDFDHQPYVLKVPADESPIDIGRLVDFEQQLAMSPQEIRDTVGHLSWKRQMEIVTEQTA